MKKLGIRTDHKLILINAPTNYFELLESDVTKQICKRGDTPDLVHLFVKNMNDLERAMKNLKASIKKNPNISIWVSWYKKSAGIATDVTEDLIRGFALKNGLVDVKVCAVSNAWSGLKLVVPLALRKRS